MTLILVDEPLQKAIQKLNDAKLYTVDCCAGHFEDEIPNMYISFFKKINNAPQQFKLEKNNTVIRHIYKNLKSKTEFRKEQEEILENLNEWINENIKNR